MPPEHYFARFLSQDPATTEVYTLSLHDALPILVARLKPGVSVQRADGEMQMLADRRAIEGPQFDANWRSEEHTSELQSPDHLVCRLLLEKKQSRYRLDILRRASTGRTGMSRALG